MYINVLIKMDRPCTRICQHSFYIMLSCHSHLSLWILLDCVVLHKKAILGIDTSITQHSLPFRGRHRTQFNVPNVSFDAMLLFFPVKGLYILSMNYLSLSVIFKWSFVNHPHNNLLSNGNWRHPNKHLPPRAINWDMIT